MTKKYSISLLSSFLLIFLFHACNQPSAEEQSRVDQLPYFHEATFTPLWLDANNLPDTLHAIPSFSLVNQEGDSISEQTFEDKIYVTDFFFTSCPGICKQMTENMTILQDEFLEDEEVLLLSHTVTPRRDSVPILKNYAEAKGINTQTWHLATGTKKEIYTLGRKAYFVEEDLGFNRKEDEFLHTENFVLIDQNKHIRGIYNGLNKSSIQQLIADIRLLKKES